MKKKSKIKHIGLQVGDSYFDAIWQLYMTAFPHSERRDLEQQQKLLTSSDNYHCDALFYEDNLLGLLFWWHFSVLNFMEHFAIFPQYRNQGFGEKVLRNFMAESSRPILLEVEPPVDAITQRRVSFYERLGFVINDVAYQQPPYRKGEKEVTLLLLSCPQKFTDKELQYFKRVCFSEIYALR